jgi:hypothetical protein
MTDSKKIAELEHKILDLWLTVKWLSVLADQYKLTLVKGSQTFEALKRIEAAVKDIEATEIMNPSEIKDAVNDTIDSI